MPSTSAQTTSQRLLALLSLLQSNRDWPAPVLAGRLEISERTVRRDVDRLRELGYAIDATRGPDGGYRLEAGKELPPLLLDDEQAIAIALALRTAGSTGAAIGEAADRALETVSRLLPDRLRRRIAALDVEALPLRRIRGETGTQDPSPPLDPTALLLIGAAISAREELRFDYTSVSATRVSAPRAPADAAEPADPVAPPRRVEPHHVLLSGGRWYLIGWSPERDDWRVFRVDRMELRSHTGRRFERKVVPGGSASEYLAARFKGSARENAWACRGEATLLLTADRIAPYVAEGQMEALDDQSSRVRLGSWSWGSLAAAFLRFDGGVRDAEPAELRDAFALLANRSRAATK